MNNSRVPDGDGHKSNVQRPRPIPPKIPTRPEPSPAPGYGPDLNIHRLRLVHLRTRSVCRLDPVAEAHSPPRSLFVLQTWPRPRPHPHPHLVQVCSTRIAQWKAGDKCDSIKPLNITVPEQSP